MLKYEGGRGLLSHPLALVGSNLQGVSRTSSYVVLIFYSLASQWLCFALLTTQELVTSPSLNSLSLCVVENSKRTTSVASDYPDPKNGSKSH